MIALKLTPTDAPEFLDLAGRRLARLVALVPAPAVRVVALFMQAIIQGAFVISKAGGDPALAAQCLDHLKQYLTLLFSRQFGAT